MELDAFRTAVEAHIAERDMTPTAFGRIYAGDPLFVFQLREGREPRTATRERVLSAMSDPAPSREDATREVAR